MNLQQGRSAFLGLITGLSIVASQTPVTGSEIATSPAAGDHASTYAVKVPSQTVLDSLVELDGIVVTGTRSPRQSLDVPAIIYCLGRQSFSGERLVRTVPEALSVVPGAMVQKTAYGQGSPFLRGFTGFRTLLMVDGIRLNNSVFRDGPNQYASTIDLLSASDIEVVMGAGSVLYGTDAVGGVVNVIPTSPRLMPGSYPIRPTLSYRYSTAEHSNIARMAFQTRMNDRLSAAVGISGKDFGDLTAGGSVGRLAKTGYGEWNGDLTANYSIAPNQRLKAAYQQTVQDDVWRTHRTIYGVSWEGTSVGSDLRFVHDQTRRLAYVRYSGIDLGHGVRQVSATISYQQQEEDQERQKSSGSTRWQGFDVRTVGLGLQTEREIGRSHLMVGADLYRDYVDSYADDFDASGALVGHLNQGPVADDATYDTWETFAQLELPLHRFNVLVGGRSSYIAADADRVQDPVESNRVYAIRQDWYHLTGAVRLAYRIGKQMQAFAGVSHAFRAPNLSDLTRFDVALSKEIEVPSPDLTPETYLCYEIGLKAQRDRWSGEVGMYYTDIDDLILRAPTGIMLDDDMIVTKKNAGDGYVAGIEGEMAVRMTTEITLNAGAAMLYGEVEAYTTSSPKTAVEPLDKLTPPSFRAEAIWRPTNSRAWVCVQMSTARHQDKLSTADRLDSQRIPPGGTPGYTVFSVRGGYRVTSNLLVSLSLENLFDQAYRIHGSGQNEAGRNFVVGFTLQ